MDQVRVPNSPAEFSTRASGGGCVASGVAAICELPLIHFWRGLRHNGCADELGMLAAASIPRRLGGKPRCCCRRGGRNQRRPDPECAREAPGFPLRLPPLTRYRGRLVPSTRWAGYRAVSCRIRGRRAWLTQPRGTERPVPAAHLVPGSNGLEVVAHAGMLPIRSCCPTPRFWD